MIVDIKSKENKEISKRKKLKEKGEIMKVERTNKRVEETGNYTKSLDIIRKSVVCGDKDPRLDN
jgi:hypothetical protein